MTILPIPSSNRGDESRAYQRVSELLQQGRWQEARQTAAAIQVPHVRDMAFVLVERSRPMAA